MGKLVAVALGLTLVACDAKPPIAPTMARAPGLSVCVPKLAKLPSFMEHFEASLKAAGYLVVSDHCDVQLVLAIAWESQAGYRTYVSEAITIHNRQGEVIDILTLQSSIAPDDLDRLATLMVNAVNRSGAIAAISPNDITRPTSAKSEPIWDTDISNNGLILVRYPSTFAANTVGQSVIMLSARLDDSAEEDLTFISIPKPSSNKLKPFAEDLIGREIPELPGYVEQSRKDGSCAGAQPGVEVEATWLGKGIVNKRWSCTFLRAGHGYSFAYDLPVQRVATDEGMLKAIVTSVRFVDP